MNKLLLSLALTFAFNAAYAADSGRGWYENLMKSLKTKVQKKFEPKNTVIAVAAVRGAKQGGDTKTPYWKGGVSEAAREKNEAERGRLAEAVQLVLDGKTAAARTALEKFIAENPGSGYLPKAREALEKLPAEAGTAGAKAAKPAKTEKPAQAQPKAGAR